MPAYTTREKRKPVPRITPIADPAPTHACPACQGLQCLERPRFFAGQLITEAELNGEVDYVRAKNRLHNRYLHGVGVVCGLEVTCDECDGWVRVSPGYAIDPCGNDVVVCEQQGFDVLTEIERCRERKQRSPLGDCDPVDETLAADCEGIAEHWCLTIAYAEKETRATTALRRSTATSGSSGCGCGCGGSCGCGGHANGNGNGHSNGNGCGCGGDGGAATTATAPQTVSGGVGTSIGQCEPTRILETFRLGIAQGHPGPCTDLKDILNTTAFGEIVKCIRNFGKTLAWRVPPSSYAPIYGAVFEQNYQYDPQTSYEAYCYLRQGLLDYAAEDPHAVRCGLRRKLDAVAVPAPPAQLPDERNRERPVIRSNDFPEEYVMQPHAAYTTEVRGGINALIGITVESLVECFCQALLPPCGADPTDDRLILACMTIDRRNGRIIQICNHGCRRHAGSFPAVKHWLSIVPILPLIGLLVEELCCTELVGWVKPTKRNKLVGGLDRVDPGYKRRQTIAESDYALPRMLLIRAQRARRLLTAPTLARLVENPSRIVEEIRSLFGGRASPDS